MYSKNKLIQFANYFNEGSLFEKILAIGRKAGTNLIFYALILYFLVTDKDIPMRTRLVFFAALGYFIFPFDLISDFLPGLGFSDDLTFMTYAITQGTDHITPEIKLRAKEKMKSLLGNKEVINQQETEDDNSFSDGVVWSEN